MKKRFLLLVLLCGCTTSQLKIDKMPASERASNIDCKPKVLTSSGKLAIQLPRVHGGDSAIIDPKGEHFFISFYQPDKESSFQPIIPATIFSRITNFSITSETKGYRGSRRDGTKENIFSEDGIYELIVSPALETEEPILDGWCKFQYKK
jgi:hypothetical protein